MPIMRLPRQLFPPCQRLAVLLCCGWLGAASLHASTTVHLVQTAVDDQSSAPLAAVAADAWLETGRRVYSLTAPAAYNGYRVTHWTNDSYPAEGYRDDWGRAENPIDLSLTHI